MLHLLPRVLLLGGLLAAAQGWAQTMYRCGSVYQDRPCDAGTKGKAVGSTGTSAAPASAAGITAECARRGRDSNKIVWAREGGATEERLLSEARSPIERRLIQDVYRRPGAASTVQAAVEADCVAEKQREEYEAALAPVPSGVAVREPDPTAQAEAAARAAQQRAEYDAEQKKRRCASYNQDMERLRTSQRTGGSVSTMESLNAQMRSLRDDMSRAGC